MTNITLSPPIVGQKNTSEEPKVGTALKAIEQYLNQTVLGTGIGTGNIVKESVTEEKLSAAVQTLLNKAAAGLILTKQAGSTTGSSGNLYLMETNATTLTLPAATSGRQVGIICKTAIAEVKLKATGVKIFGDFLAAAGVETITLVENQHVTVGADGTNWWIIAGESKREQKYATTSLSRAEAETGVTPSLARPAIVNAVVISEINKPCFGAFKAGGVVVSEFLAGAVTALATKQPQSFWVNPGQKWELTAGSTGVTNVSAYTILQ